MQGEIPQSLIMLRIFSRVNLVTKTKGVSVTALLSDQYKSFFFRKKKLGVEQLNSSKFIKYVCRLIISTSNAKIEVHSLHHVQDIHFSLE